MLTANRDSRLGAGAPAGQPAASSVLVLGERYPSETPLFRGVAGQAFAGVLEEAGIPNRKSRFANTGPELPAPAELQAAGIRFAVLTGDDALAVFRPDLEVRHLHGRPFRSDSGIVCVAVFHYVSLLRRPQWRPLVLAELQRFREVARGVEWVAKTCTRCRGELYRTDRQGIALCEEHWRDARRQV